MTILLTTGLEVSLRRNGHQPSVTDTPVLWAYQRSAVYPRQAGEKVLVMIGASRIQLGISTDELRKQLPGIRPVQLALDGSSFLPVLESLAEDTLFSRLLLVSVVPFYVQNRVGRAQEYVDLFDHRAHSLNDQINMWFETTFQSQFVMRSMHLPNIIENFVRNGAPPSQNYLVMNTHRSRSADYTKIDIQDFRMKHIEKLRIGYETLAPVPASQNDFLANVSIMETWISKIHARGGRVALVYFPVEGALLEIHEEYFPKNVFWDAMAEQVSAVTVHFLDEPSLQAFELPDASHLDFRDAPGFTAALIELLAQQGFFH